MDNQFPQYQFQNQPWRQPVPYRTTYVPQLIQNGSSSIIWVQGESGAKAYPVGPGNRVILMDSEQDRFYIKSTDINGKPEPLRAYEYKEISDINTEEVNPVVIDNSEYATKEDLESIKDSLASLKKSIDELMS